MTMNFPGLTGQAGGAVSSQVITLQDQGGGLQGLRGVDIGWSGWPALVELTER